MSDEDGFHLSGEDMPEEIREALDRFFSENPDKLRDGVAMFTPDNMHELPPEVQNIVKGMIHSQLARSLMQRTITGHAPGADRLNDEYLPSDQQLHLQHGDKCVVSYGGVEDQTGEILLAELLDPADYAHHFPDWEERVYNGWLLARYWTRDHAEMDLADEPEMGWFSRISLLKIAEEWQWPLYWEWMKAGSYPEDPPPWLLQNYIGIFDGISRNNNDLLPTPSECVECGSQAVLAVTERIVESKYFVGKHKELDEKHGVEDALYGYTRYGHKHKAHAKIVCYECEHEQPIDNDNFFVGIGPEEDHDDC